MPSMMPTQVVAALDQLFPHAATGQPGGSIQPSHSPKIQALLDLVNEIPEQLIVLDPGAYATFVHARATMRDAMAIWVSRGATGGMSNVGNVDAVTALRSALVKLRDDFPAPKHTNLAFISDDDIREDILLDVGTAERSLHHSEWKPAMVMAGAVIEDLLHLKLRQLDPALLQAAVTAPKDALDRWNLSQMIDVSEELGILRRANTLTSARLTKDYRNLIHPGRRARRSERPTRARAYTAIGGMYGVIDELS